MFHGFLRGNFTGSAITDPTLFELPCMCGRWIEFASEIHLRSGDSAQRLKQGYATAVSEKN